MQFDFAQTPALLNNLHGTRGRYDSDCRGPCDFYRNANDPVAQKLWTDWNAVSAHAFTVTNFRLLSIFGVEDVEEFVCRTGSCICTPYEKGFPWVDKY
jgi:hypothetical protein